MKKVLLIFALILGVFSAYGQTGTDIINKYKANKAVTYLNVDVNGTKESLTNVEDSLQTMTAGVIDKAFLNKFIAGVKGVRSLETVVIPAESEELLNEVKGDVNNLSDNGYMVVVNRNISGNKIGELSLAKIEGGSITEIVSLTPIKDKKAYALIDMVCNISIGN